MNTMSIYTTELNQIKKHFESCDHNLDGTLSIEEVQYVLGKTFS